MNILLVGIGGIFGSITRYWLGSIISSRVKTTFPLGTFIINITGSILLGFVVGIHPANNIYLIAAEGFLGAYTTFSTFMYEGFSLVKDAKALNALLYIIGSVAIGILGFAVGLWTYFIIIGR